MNLNQHQGQNTVWVLMLIAKDWPYLRIGQFQFKLEDHTKEYLYNSLHKLYAELSEEVIKAGGPATDVPFSVELHVGIIKGTELSKTILEWDLFFFRQNWEGLKDKYVLEMLDTYVNTVDEKLLILRKEGQMSNTSEVDKGRCRNEVHQRESTTAMQQIR